MTRKERKHARRAARKQRQPDATIEKLARAIAKGMKSFPRYAHENEKHLCDICTLRYCVGFDGKEVFCRECHYEPACQKQEDISIKKHCTFCEAHAAQAALQAGGY